MEEVKLPVDTVDVIVSEWMGYALLYESMLNSVLHARDKWLVPGGVLLPDQATIYVSAIEDHDYKAEKVTWWESVYGFDMSCMKSMVMREPLVDVVDPGQVVTGYQPVFKFDVANVTVADLSFDVPFELQITRDDYVHALVLHFDTAFARCHAKPVLPTGPANIYTHWKQTVFYLSEVLTAQAGEIIHGRLTCRPNAKNHRHMDFDLTVKFEGALGSADFSQHYEMR